MVPVRVLSAGLVFQLCFWLGKGAGDVARAILDIYVAHSILDMIFRGVQYDWDREKTFG